MFNKNDIEAVDSFLKDSGDTDSQKVPKTSTKKRTKLHTFVFVNDSNDTAFFSTDRNQQISDDFLDFDFLKPCTKKWILNKMDATEIPNPNPELQA